MDHRCRASERASPSNPDVRLASGEMRAVDFTRALRESGQERNIETASLEFEYTGAPGMVLVAAHTMSQDANQVFRVPMWDPLGQRSPTGGYPWYFEGVSATTVYLKNVTDREQQYVAHLIYEGGTYMLGLKTLAAHQTVTVDIRRLRDEGVPDEAGRVIPPNVTRGQVKWSLKQTDETRANDPFERLAIMGRSEQVDAEQGTSSNYACQNCCSDSFVIGYVSPSSADMEVGAQQQFVAYDTTSDCYFNYSTHQVSAYWSSNNTSVATVNGNGLVTVVGAGDATIRAHRWVTEYFAGGGGTGCGGTFRADIADAPDAAERQGKQGGGGTGGRVYEPLIGEPCDAYGCQTAGHWRDDGAPIVARPTITSITPARGLVGSTINVTMVMIQNL